jgi:hypothetical protein
MGAHEVGDESARNESLVAAHEGLLPALIANERTKRLPDIGAAVVGSALFAPMFSLLLWR